MHEMSIVVSLMDQVYEIVEQNHLAFVSEIEVGTGVLRQVIPEVMQEAFYAVKEGTVAEDAELKINEIAIAGGVSANSELRKQLEALALKLNWNTYIPKFEYCTDNAAMIAITGYYKYLNKEFVGLDVHPSSRLKF